MAKPKFAGTEVVFLSGAGKGGLPPLPQRTASDAQFRRVAEQAKDVNAATLEAALKIENKYGPTQKNGWKKQKMPPDVKAKLNELLKIQKAAMDILNALPEKYRGDYGLRFI
jgi:hypothetical protein